MFGFGKKISYLELIHDIESCMTIRRQVDNLLKNVSEYQENRDIDDELTLPSANLQAS